MVPSDLGSRPFSRYLSTEHREWIREALTSIVPVAIGKSFLKNEYDMAGYWDSGYNYDEGDYGNCWEDQAGAFGRPPENAHCSF